MYKSQAEIIKKINEKRLLANGLFGGVALRPGFKTRGLSWDESGRYDQAHYDIQKLERELVLFNNNKSR